MKLLEKPLIQLTWHQTVRNLIRDETRMLCLVGEPGIGKTTFARQIARELRGDPIVFNGSSEADLSALWGRWGIRGSDTVFKPGPLHTSIAGNRVLLIEDFGLIPLEARAALLGLDQEQIENPFTNQVLAIPKDYVLLCTSNPENLGCRRNAGIATVLWDRFTIVNIPEPQLAEWRLMLYYEFSELDEYICEEAVSLFMEWRSFTQKSDSNRTILTFRSLKRLVRFLASGMDQWDAVELAIVNSIMPNDKELADAARLKLDMSRPAREI